MKLADLTENEVIEEFRKDATREPMAAYRRLCERYPEKIVQARYEAMITLGFLSAGVSARTAWLNAEHEWPREPRKAKS